MVCWCLAFILGMGLFFSLPALPPWPWCLLALALWLLLTGVCYRAGSKKYLLFSHGLYTALVYQLLFFSLYYSNWRPEPGNNDYEIVAEVSNIVLPLRYLPENKSQKLLLSLRRVDGRAVNSAWWQPRSFIRVSWYPKESGEASPPSLARGDLISFTAKLSHIYGFENQAGFNFSQWLFAKAVLATGYIKSEITTIETSNTSPQTAFDVLLVATQDSRNQGHFLALSLGYRGLITMEQRALLKELGIGHLLAISGLHIGIIFVFLFSLLKLTVSICRVRVEYAWLLLISLAALWYYLYLLDFVISALRACLLLTLWVGLGLRFSNLNRFKLLLLVACVSLIWQPAAILQAGWWLSFVAVFFIFVFLSRYGTNSTREREKPGSKFEAIVGIWLNRSRDLILLQIWIGITLMPVTLYWFGGISLSGFVANLFAIPYFSLVIVPLNFLISLLTLLELPSVEVLYLGLDAALDGFWWLMSILRSELGYQYLPNTLFGLGLFAILGFLVQGGSRRSASVSYGSIFILSVPIISSLEGHVWRAPLQMRVMDVGQGTGIGLFQGASGWLYDLGPVFRSGFNATDAVVVPTMHRLGIGRLDALVISHHDSDHLGRPESVLNRFPVDHVQNGCKNQSLLINKVRRWSAHSWQLFWPRQTTEPAMNIKLSDNDSSCVVKFTHGTSGYSILLTGDISSKVERTLSKLHGDRLLDLSADILISAHHGSKHSSLSEFIALVSPKLVIHSSGVNNRFGFPTPEVEARFALAGVEQLSTNEDGEILIHFPNDHSGQLMIKTKLNQWTPFWKRQNPFSIVQQIR